MPAHLYQTRACAKILSKTEQTNFFECGSIWDMQGAKGFHAPKVLLIEGDQQTADSIRAALSVSGPDRYDVNWARTLATGLALASQTDLCAILVNLSLPDSGSIETFHTLFAAAAGVPILIIGPDDQEALAKEAVLQGAHDYILKEHLNSYSLPRALHYACRSKEEEKPWREQTADAIFTLDSIGDAVLCIDVASHITYLNPIAEKMTGWRLHEAAGKPLTDVFHIIDGSTGETARDPLAMAMKEKKTVGLTPNCILIRRDGAKAAIEDSASPVYGGKGAMVGAVIVFRDVSEARAMALRMARAAHHDYVTDLPNRTLLNDRIDQAITLASRHKRPVAVLFLDLDGFKAVNDSLGHAVGDLLLQSVARRLTGSVRRADTVSRQGGDEFVILLTEINHRNDAAVSANKLLVALNTPHAIHDQNVSIHASIGISLYPDDGEDAETLIRNADIAMYRVKKARCNLFQFFEERMTAEA